MNTPEISVQDLEDMLKSKNEFVLLDVREPWELTRAAWDDSRLQLAPLSQLSQHGVEFSKFRDSKVVIVCHHGIRSAHVTNWLLSQGLADVVSLRGGIEAYALDIDSSVGRY